jgi:hypothetical protein
VSFIFSISLKLADKFTLLEELANDSDIAEDAVFAAD